jgi:hypothetical protein
MGKNTEDRQNFIIDNLRIDDDTIEDDYVWKGWKSRFE